MPTIVDSLVVELKLDPTNLERGSEKAQESVRKTKASFQDNAKAINETSAKISEGIQGVAKSALAMFGVFLTARGAKEFTEQTTRANAALGRLGENLKTSPQAIRAWGYAAERLGGSAEATARSFQSLGDMVEGLKTRGEALPLAFYQIQAASGKQIDLNDGLERTFSDVADALQKIYQVDPQKADFLGRQLGLDADTVNLMERNGSRIKKIVEDAKGLAPTDEMIRRSQELQTSWSSLAQSAESFGRSIVSDISPALSAAADATARMLNNGANPDKAIAASPAKKAIYDQTLAPGHKGLLDDWLSGLGGKSADVAVDGSPVTKANPLPVTIAGQSSGSGGGFWDSVSNALRGGGSGSGGGGGGAGGIANSLSHLFGGGGSGSTGKWWTPDRMKHAADRLQKEAGLSEEGAAGLVARWAGVESPGGPESVNPTSGAFGVGQWLGGRQNGIAGNTDFDAQISHAVSELNGSEKAAGDALRKATSPADGARGASMFERAEGYNPGTGTDNFTNKTPVQAVLDAMHGGVVPPGAGQPYGTGDYFVIGDSTGKRLMNANGWGGNATERESPAQIMARVQALRWKDVANKKIVIAAGSNDTSQIGKVGDMISWLTRLGVKPDNIDVMGMGDRPDLAAHNKDLMDIAKKYGTHFSPMGPTDDQVHERDPKALGGQIKGVFDNKTSAIDWSSMSLAGRNAVLGAQAATTTSNQVSHETNVNSVTINTQATEAGGIARDFTNELSHQSLAAQANYGTV